MAKQSKIVSIIGATGAQGGSVARSLGQNSDFEVRCITRDASSVGAKRLISEGFNVIEVSGAKNEEMEQTLAGSWGIFINVDTHGKDFDIAVTLQTKILSSAAAAGVKHVVFSSAPDARKLTAGQAPVPTLDVKAQAAEWGDACPVFETFTPVMLSWYLENFEDSFLAELLGGFPIHQDRDGYLNCRVPLWGGREQVPFISVKDDFGDLVHGIFLNPVRWNRAVIQCHGELMSWADMVQAYVSVTGKKARFLPYIPAEEMPTFEGGGIQDLFIYSQLRGGDYYGNGPSETQTASQLKRDAWKAKGRNGRETMMTVKEYFKRLNAS
ncbi:hypothetical protein N7490_011324 [Penicillium lividum]|nr:hypothetical protein N7490_011324 [Penicillium lividum]